MPIENIEDEELETGGETDISTDEPQSSKPDTGSFSRESLKSDAFEEGTSDAIIETLAGKADVTIDDLRTLPGTEKLTDAQLQAAWDKAQTEAGTKKDGDDPSLSAKVELPFPVYDAAGNKIAADKVTLGDLLSGKALVGYNAMGKEQRKSLNDVIRNASQGHWNEHRYTTVQSQYRETAKQVETLRREAEAFETQRGQWNDALTALVMGNNAPMKAMVEAYKGALGKSGVTPEGYVSRESVDAEAVNNERGMQWYSEVGLPAAMDIAKTYNADAKEVIGAIKYFIENEPVLTPQRIEEILKYDVPMEFEKNGYTANGIRTGGITPNGQANTNELETLQKQVTALTARLADSKNERTNAIRDKSKRIPPAGSGVVGGAGDSMPNFKTRDEMKEWLRSQ